MSERNFKRIAEDLYNAMNALDCGCTFDGEDVVDLQDGGRTAEFYGIQYSDKYDLVVVNKDGCVLYTKEVGFASYEDDSKTVEMFERMLNDGEL